MQAMKFRWGTALLHKPYFVGGLYYTNFSSPREAIEKQAATPTAENIYAVDGDTVRANPIDGVLLRRFYN